MCSKNIHNFVCCWLFSLEKYKLKKPNCEPLTITRGRKKFSTQITSATQHPSHTYLIKNVFTGVFFFFNHQTFCKWILFRDNSIINIIFMVKLLTSKFLSNSQAKNWFYPNYFEYIVIHWMPESKKSIKDKSAKTTTWKISHTRAIWA